MTALELFKNLKVRFNTSPRLYEKEDYGVLIKLLYEIIQGIESIKKYVSDLETTLNLKIELIFTVLLLVVTLCNNLTVSSGIFWQGEEIELPSNEELQTLHRIKIK